MNQYETICGMAKRLRGRVVRRPSLPLTEQDERDLEVIRSTPAYLRALLDKVTPGEDVPADGLTESALIHAIFEAGLRTVRDDVQASAYAKWGDERARDTAARRQAARRRTPAWADEP
jgi:hypothetical protein